MAPLRDIAGEAGVSIRTVTRTLSSSGYVRADVRDRIVAIAARLGYRPDPVAQSLRLGRSRQIVVVSHSADELHMAKIASLEQSVRPLGFWVSVMIARHEELEKASFLGEIRARKPAGVAEATRYLLRRGRRRIVYLGPEDSTSRMDGFTRALANDRKSYRRG